MSAKFFSWLLLGALLMGKANANVGGVSANPLAKTAVSEAQAEPQEPLGTSGYFSDDESEVAELERKWGYNVCQYLLIPFYFIS